MLHITCLQEQFIHGSNMGIEHFDTHQDTKHHQD